MNDSENHFTITGEFLSQQNWDEILLKLINYARMKVAKLRWKTRSQDVLAGGCAADDLACNAIELFINCTRQWNNMRYPDLLEFLKSIVDSLISNLVNSADNIRRNEFDEDTEHHQLSNGSKQMAHSPELLLIIEEEEALAEEALNRLFEEISDDTEMETFLGYYLGGEGNLKEIAACMGISASRAYL